MMFTRARLMSQHVESFPKLRALESLHLLEEVLHELAVAQNEIWQRPFLAGKLLRIFQRAFQNEPRHRIQIGGRHFATEPHRFEWDCSAAGKWVEHFRRTTAVGFA